MTVLNVFHIANVRFGRYKSNTRNERFERFPTPELAVTLLLEKSLDDVESAKMVDFEPIGGSFAGRSTDSIDYVSSREFLRPTKWLQTDESIVNDLIEKITQSGKATAAGLPVHLDRMAHSTIMTADEETAIFRQMNFRKFQASLLNGDPTCPSLAIDEAVQSHLAIAQDLRDVIVKANIRLVMSIAKRFVTPTNSFDELLSDGIMTLMQTVEKFDYSRGFRFSTYAYRSIARSLSRKVAQSSKDRSRYMNDADDWAFEQEQDRPLSEHYDQMWSNVREVATSLLSQLDRRERFIIRCRFALGSHRKTRSYQFLADKLGVSKERVRQLAHRALGKLRTMAAAFDIDELFGAALA